MIRLAVALFLLGCASAQTTSTACVGQPQYTFVAHETDCWRYYTCVNEQAFPQECPEPFIFVQATQMCDFGDRNACVNCPPTGIHNLPVTGSCTQFIQCIEGTQFPRECPPGTQFDTVAGQCNIASVVGCVALDCPAVDDPQNPVIKPDPNDCQVYYICIGGQGVEQNCPPGTRFNPTLQVCDLEANVVCPATPAQLGTSNTYQCQSNRGMTFEPLPNSCTDYIMCINSVPYEMSCAPGKSFDSLARLCMDTAQAKCLLDTKFLCAATTVGISTVAYPNSCSKYLLCIYGEAYEIECPSHELYDSFKRRCVPSAEALCSNGPPTLPDLKPFANPCADNVGVNNVPDPSNCQRYFMCINTQFREVTCPGNQIFDIYSRSCGPVMHSTCIRDIDAPVAPSPPPPPPPPPQPSPSPAPTPVNPNNPCRSNNGVSYKPHPTDCSRYFMCMDTQPFEQRCPAGQAFDINTENCRVRQGATCIVDVSPCADNVGISYKPHLQDCGRYYMCMDTQSFEQTCPSGQVFDVNTATCGSTQTSTCILDQHPTDPTPPVPAPVPTIPTPVPTIPTPAPTIPTPAPSAPNPCASNTGVNYLPHPQDCTRYYMCMDTTPFEQTCGAGQVFDIFKATCGPTGTSTCILDPINPEDVPKPPTPPPSINPLQGCLGNVGIKNVPHPTDCTRFYLCVDEMAFEQQCGPNLVFDIESALCDRPENSICVENIATPPTAGPGDAPAPPTPPTPAPPTIPTPPLPTAPTPPVTEDEAPTAPTAGPVTPAPEIPTAPTLPGPTPAPPGEVPTAPTPTSEVPTAPTPAPTVPTPAPTLPPPTQPPPTLPPPTLPPPTVPPPTIPPPVPTPPPPPTGNPPTCPPGELFYYPHPDCTRFYRCVWGTLHVMTCPPNLFWNQEREFCDHPFNVNCPSLG